VCVQSFDGLVARGGGGGHATLSLELKVRRQWWEELTLARCWLKMKLGCESGCRGVV
jgi:hypothetical protein